MNNVFNRLPILCRSVIDAEDAIEDADDDETEELKPAVHNYVNNNNSSNGNGLVAAPPVLSDNDLMPPPPLPPPIIGIFYAFYLGQQSRITQRFMLKKIYFRYLFFQVSKLK